MRNHNSVNMEIGRIMEQYTLNVKRVAALFGVSEATIRNWARSGELPAIQVGSQYRFSNEDVSEFIKSHKVQVS